MSRFIASGFQSAVRSIIFYSRRQLSSMMAAFGSNSETDRDDSEKEDVDDLHIVSYSDEAESDTELSNGNSVKLSVPKTSDDGSDVLDSGSPDQKQQVSVGSSSKMPVLGQEDYSLRGMLFANQQPKRQFHFSLWNRSEKGYRTREQVVREEKG